MASDAPFPLAEIDVDGAPLVVWVADESSERRRGLMNLEQLPAGVDGMLFVFPAASAVSFHMRDTFVDLDIWWFDAEMRLIGTDEMEPCPEAPCARYPSPGEVKWALETPQGVHEFEQGSRLSIVEND